MFNYFRELLATLKSIDENLKAIRANSDRVNKCVTTDLDKYGTRRNAIITGHWNDGL